MASPSSDSSAPTTEGAEPPQIQTAPAPTGVRAELLQDAMSHARRSLRQRMQQFSLTGKKGIIVSGSPAGGFVITQKTQLP